MPGAIAARLRLTGGIEAGGTNFVCGAGNSPADLISEEFRTTTPDETIARVAAFFTRHPVEALGIGCFGPVDLRAGTITTTPKELWRNFAVVEALRSATGISRIAFTTDVNAAARGEHAWGAARGIENFIYLTCGTGIGGGAMVQGKLLEGSSHPEMGHVRIPHDLVRDPFPGACYAHGDCLEGLASGLAIERRWGMKGEHLPAGHEAWPLEAHYLALGLATLTTILTPAKIILGGSVMRSTPLDLVDRELRALLSGYIPAPVLSLPALGDHAGVLGAIALAAAC